MDEKREWKEKVSHTSKYAPTFLQNANLYGYEIHTLLEEYRVEVESMSCIEYMHLPSYKV